MKASVRQGTQGVQGQGFLPLMTIELVAIGLVKAGFRRHENVDVMATPFHFAEGGFQEFTADTTAPRCRMRSQADDIGGLDFPSPQAERVGIQMGQAGHLSVLEA